MVKRSYLQPSHRANQPYQAMGKYCRRLHDLQIHANVPCARMALVGIRHDGGWLRPD
nr:MAG TPA: hypothetical protein [Caudoviricetes sp.]